MVDGGTSEHFGWLDMSTSKHTAQSSTLIQDADRKKNKIEKRKKGEGKHEKRRAGIYLQKKRRLYTAWVYLRTAVSMGV